MCSAMPATAPATIGCRQQYSHTRLRYAVHSLLYAYCRHFSKYEVLCTHVGARQGLRSHGSEVCCIEVLCISASTAITAHGRATSMCDVCCSAYVVLLLYPLVLASHQ